jgi:hypothetical protein
MRTDRLYFFTHDCDANDAKTPKELYEAIECLGPLPRYLTRHDCTGKETHLTESAVEEAKAVYLHARKIANWIRKSKPDLPPLPPSETDPFLGIQTVSEWCIEADLAEKEEAERNSQRGKFGFRPKEPRE